MRFVSFAARLEYIFVAGFLGFAGICRWLNDYDGICMIRCWSRLFLALGLLPIALEFRDGCTVSESTSLFSFITIMESGYRGDLVVA